MGNLIENTDVKEDHRQREDKRRENNLYQQCKGSNDIRDSRTAVDNRFPEFFTQRGQCDQLRSVND